jgi:hypothetical protein
MQHPPTKRDWKREIVSLATLLTLLFLYFPFMDRPWSLYVAISAAYTMLVLGLLWSDGKWKRYIEEGRRTARELLQGHLCFALLIVVWIWLGRYSKPRLPEWMFNYGLGELTLYLIFSGLGIVAIWWAEQTWLAQPVRRDASINASPQQ